MQSPQCHKDFVQIFNKKNVIFCLLIQVTMKKIPSVALP